MHFRKLNWALISIVALALILRLWRLESLTTFSGDQGYDFLIVKRMIVDGKFTLLGPKIGPYNKIGNLYLGPAYYYLLVPSLMLSHLDPIGPAALTVALAVATVFMIYLICLKFIAKRVALLASAIYALNPFLVNQSRAPSNPHLIPFFSTVYIYSMLKIAQSKLLLWPVLCGLSLGIMFQLHYLTSALFIPTILILIYIRKLKSLFLIVFSFIVAESPQIIFELRHDFFVTKIFMKQLSLGENFLTISKLISHLYSSFYMVLNIFFQITKPMTAAALILVFLTILYVYIRSQNTEDSQSSDERERANTYFRGLEVLLAHVNLKDNTKTFQASEVYRNRKTNIAIYFLVSIIVFGFIFASLYNGNLEPHYLAQTYAAITIVIAILFFSLFDKTKNHVFKVLLIFLLAILFMVYAFNLNLSSQNGYTMPPGWNLGGEEKTSRIIADDAKTSNSFNIAATLDGDTRAMPYRYLVEIYGEKPQSVEDYPNSQVIYLISKDEEDLIKRYTVWEVSSFRPFKIDQKWQIQNGISLYKLKHENQGKNQ